LAGVAVAALFAHASLAAPVASDGLAVEGNRRVDADTIRAFFVGRDRNEGLKALYATGLFKDAQVVKRGRQTVVRVVENETTIGRVVFVGNGKVKSEQLEAEVMSKGNGQFSQQLVDADVVRVLDVYRRAGRMSATVKERKVDLPNGMVDVVFEVDEGDKTGVREIRFSGNAAFSSSRLAGLMQTTEMNWFSFIKTSDVYDPDQLARDEEAIRRFYRRSGYADFHVVGSSAVYDPAKKGYVVVVTVAEGQRYTVGAVAVESGIRGVPGGALTRALRVAAGDAYDGDRVEKTVEALTMEIAQRGYAFSQVKAHEQRDPGTGKVSLEFAVEEGPRVYVERIEIHGNTATRDNVIRREFDISEGDAYNKALVERTERRLNALGFFKKVKIVNAAGSSPDRVVLDVELEEQSTGQFSVSGGYSTTEGFLAEVSVSQSNFLGRGDYIRAAVSVGQYASGVELNYTEPFFLDQRLAAGFDLYSKLSGASPYAYYSNWVTGGAVRLGIPLTEEITFAPHYSLYNSRLSIPDTASKPYDDCGHPVVGVTPGTPGAAAVDAVGGAVSCLSNGEASLALKQAQGDWVTSMVGYALSYNGLDRPRDPHEGVRADFKQDFAGAGGDAKFLRTTADVRGYHELFSDEVVGVAHLQAGDVVGLGQQLRVVDNFNLGQGLVRGFAPGGIGPRDVTNTVGGNNNGNALGGSRYFGGSLEAQFPIWGLPRDLGLKGAVFSDAGTLFGYKGATNFGSYLGYASGTPCAAMAAPKASNGTPLGQSGCLQVGGDDMKIRSSIGAGLIWASPMGPIRFNYAFALSKDSADVVQQFSFSGGTNF
jgi:outer membrane protein insertion porin family